MLGYLEGGLLIKSRFDLQNALTRSSFNELWWRIGVQPLAPKKKRQVHTRLYNNPMEGNPRKGPGPDTGATTSVAMGPAGRVPDSPLPRTSSTSVAKGAIRTHGTEGPPGRGRGRPGGHGDGCFTRERRWVHNDPWWWLSGDQSFKPKAATGIKVGKIT